MVVTTTDGTDYEPHLVSKSFQGDTRNVTFILQSKRLWEFNFLAYGCGEHSIARIMISMPVILQCTLHGSLL